LTSFDFLVLIRRLLHLTMQTKKELDGPTLLQATAACLAATLL
jgi:hypothetical protein